MKTYTLMEFLDCYLGNYDNSVKAFKIIIVLGIFVEAVVSIIKENNLSRLNLRLFGEKFMEYILMEIGNIMDMCIVECKKSCRDTIIIFYVTYECLRIVYNASEIGLPVPDKIKKILEYIFSQK